MATYEVRFKQEAIYCDHVEAESAEEAEQAVLEDSQGFSSEQRSCLVEYLGPLEIMDCGPVDMD